MKKIMVMVLALTSMISFGQNNALHFDGVNDFVRFDNMGPALEGAQGVYTIEFDVKTDYTQMPTQYGVMFGINQANGGDRFVIRAAGPVDPNFGSQGVTVWFNGQYMYGNMPVGDGNCHHITYTYNKNTGLNQLYVDGILDATANGLYTVASTDVLSLGQEYDPGNVTSQHFFGEIDELRFWRTIRTEQQILDHMGQELDYFASGYGLFSYYQFNQGNAGDPNTVSTLLQSPLYPYAGDGTLLNFALNGVTSNWILNSCRANAINLDGIDDFVNLDAIAGDVAGLNVNDNAFTVEFITQLTVGVNHASEAFFSTHSSATTGNNDNIFIIQNGYNGVNPNGVVVWSRVAGQNYGLIGGASGIPINDGNCHHVAFTYIDNGNEPIQRLYIDGVLDAQSFNPVALWPTTRVSLGQEYDYANPSGWLDGHLDEVRIWSERRTVTEINQFMGQELVGDETNLLAYFNCNQGIASGNNTGITALLNTGGTADGDVTGPTGLARTPGPISNFVALQCSLLEPAGMPPAGGGEGGGRRTPENSIDDSDNVEKTDMTAYIEFENLIIQTGEFLENASITIYDMNGKLVLTDNATQTSRATLDVSHLSSGMFIVNVIADGKMYRTKFVK